MLLQRWIADLNSDSLAALLDSKVITDSNLSSLHRKNQIEYSFEDIKKSFGQNYDAKTLNNPDAFEKNYRHENMTDEQKKMADEIDKLLSVQSIKVIKKHFDYLKTILDSPLRLINSKFYPYSHLNGYLAPLAKEFQVPNLNSFNNHSSVYRDVLGVDDVTRVDKFEKFKRNAQNGHCDETLQTIKALYDKMKTVVEKEWTSEDSLKENDAALLKFEEEFEAAAKECLKKEIETTELPKNVKPTEEQAEVVHSAKMDTPKVPDSHQKPPETTREHQESPKTTREQENSIKMTLVQPRVEKGTEKVSSQLNEPKNDYKTTKQSQSRQPRTVTASAIKPSQTQLKKPENKIQQVSYLGRISLVLVGISVLLAAAFLVFKLISAKAAHESLL